MVLIGLTYIGSNIAKADMIMPNEKVTGYCVKIKNIENNISIYEVENRVFGDNIMPTKTLINENSCLKNLYMTYDAEIIAIINGKQFKVTGFDNGVLQKLSIKQTTSISDTLLKDEYVYRVGKISGDKVYVYKEKQTRYYSDNTSKVLFSTNSNPYMKIGYERVSSPDKLNKYKKFVRVNKDIYGIKK